MGCSVTCELAPHSSRLSKRTRPLGNVRGRTYEEALRESEEGPPWRGPPALQTCVPYLCWPLRRFIGYGASRCVRFISGTRGYLSRASSRLLALTSPPTGQLPVPSGQGLLTLLVDLGQTWAWGGVRLAWPPAGQDTFGWTPVGGVFPVSCSQSPDSGDATLLGGT